MDAVVHMHESARVLLVDFVHVDVIQLGLGRAQESERTTQSLLLEIVDLLSWGGYDGK